MYVYAGVETLLVEAADFMLINISVANDACAYDSRKAAQSETVQLLADRTLMSNVRLESNVQCQSGTHLCTKKRAVAR